MLWAFLHTHSPDDDFLCTDVIRETLDGPHSAKKSFFVVCVLAFWGKQSFAGISDHSLVFVMELV